MERPEQQLSPIPQLRSSQPYIVVKEPVIDVKDQQSLKNFLIHKISKDFDVIDYFFSNPYKCSALPELKALYYKDVEAHKENCSQFHFVKDSSKDNLEEHLSVISKIQALPNEESLVIDGDN